MLPAAAMIILRELPGVGERRLTRLVEILHRRHESIDHLLAARPEILRRTYGLPASAIRRLSEQRGPHLDRCRWLATEIERAGARVLMPRSHAYPPQLRRYDIPPPVMLFTLGNLDIGARPCISLLTSREITGETIPAMAAIIHSARKEKLAVALGGMKSTHRLAAMTGRALRAQRIVVLDRGLFSAFASDFTRDPFGCGDKKGDLDQDRTLVLSPFRPEDHAAPNNGRRRDEVIAALGHVVFAVSARPNGETERICLHAIKQGKPVLVWRNQSPPLVAAGALRLDPPHLKKGLRRFLDERANHPVFRRQHQSAPLPIPIGTAGFSNQRRKSRAE